MYQLDALVFSDRLLEFCAGDYDYIGAPWVGVRWLERPAVGNGGFSLRRVPSFLRVLESHRYLLGGPDRHPGALDPRRWPDAIGYRRGGASDIFWSFDAPRRHPWFRVAPVAAALRFAFEVSPRDCLELTGGEVPFGCRAWARYGRAFWDPYLLPAWAAERSGPTGAARGRRARSLSGRA